MASVTAHPDLRPARLSLLLAALLISVFVIPISVTGTSVALPVIAREMGSDTPGSSGSSTGST